MIKENKNIDKDIVSVGYFDGGEGIGRPNTRIYQELRKNWFHLVTHFLAVTILFVFLFLIILAFFMNKTELIPNYFIAIVSTIIGFYFARYL